MNKVDTISEEKSVVQSSGSGMFGGRQRSIEEAKEFSSNR